MSHLQRTVTVQEIDVAIVEYRGERVVTFAQIDKVHGRPEGTAKRNFNENEDRLESGMDFVRVSLAEMRRAFPGAFPASGGGEVVLLTRRGYYILVKSFQDDLAWKIHGEMVDAYFAALGVASQGEAVERVAPHAKDPREVRLAMNQSLRLAKMAGLEGPHALHAASV